MVSLINHTKLHYEKLWIKLAVILLQKKRLAYGGTWWWPACDDTISLPE